MTEETDMLARLRAHAEECGECSADPLPLEKLSALMSCDAAAVAPVSMSARVLAAAVPLLAANAAHAYRRRLIGGVILSLAPFPLLVFFNLYLLREAYTLLSALLPVAVVVWMVVGYAAMLLLVCALTYASLPVLIARARANALDAPAARIAESGAYA